MSKFQIPKIGFGVYLIPRSDTAKCTYEALSLGFRLIDTAELYGNERETAEGIRKFVADHPSIERDDIIYTSKIWDSDFGYESAREAIEEAYEKAGGTIQLYLMHSSGSGKTERLETWRALEDAVEAKKIRHIGVSNWGIHHIRELLEWPKLRVRPVVNQIEVNPWKQMTELVKFCHENGMSVESYSPLSMGQKLHDPTLQVLAKKYNKTPAQILLRWIIQHGVTPIPKTTSVERMKQNLETLDFELSAEDYENLGDPNAYYMAQPGWDPTKWP